MKYLLIAAAVLALSFGCSQTEGEMKPEEVVEAFSRAVVTADFDAARQFCDSATMNSYLSNYAKEVEKQLKKDSSVTNIATAILSKADFAVTKVEKDGDFRKVHYSLEVQSRTKSKVAKLRREEGEWKVVEITDSNLEN